MRRTMKPWEVIATLLKNSQVVVRVRDNDAMGAAIMCLRTGQEITLENVHRVQVEHWPRRHKHGGDVSPDNAVVSLKEGHAVQTKREQKADAKERRLAVARMAKREVETRVSRGKFRLKKKLNGDVVRVRVR